MPSHRGVWGKSAGSERKGVRQIILYFDRFDTDVRLRIDMRIYWKPI